MKWKTIEGFENFEVSDAGMVARKLPDKSRKMLTPCKCANGYYKVTLRNEKGSKSEWVHRIVAKAFVDNYKGGNVVNHKDENPANNAASNLEWCDYSYNSRYGKQFIRNMLRSKPVVQYSLDGKYIASYPSATVAAQAFGKTLNQSHITDCANGKRKNACGYVWKYKPETEIIDFNDYQRLAARTINLENSKEELIQHSLYGMASEIGELCGIFQKVYQGHEFDEEHAKKELSDILWFVAEFCSAMGISMQEVAEENIRKLLARYPEGFEAERSLHRKAGDI